MEGSLGPDIPGNLEASMLNVIEEVDSCLERILVRRSSTNSARSRNSSNMVSPVHEANAEQSRDGMQSDNSSDATIELEIDYAAGQLSTIGSSDEAVSVEELHTQSVTVPENGPLPRQLRSVETAAGQPSTSDNATGDSDEVVSVEDLGTQSVILPEIVPLPRQLRSEEVIDLSDSLPTYSNRFPAADIIELSSDEESPSTSRSTVAAQPLMHITYSTSTSRPPSQSTNIVIDLRTSSVRNRNAPSTQTSNSGTIHTLDSPGNTRPVVRSRLNGRIRLWNPPPPDPSKSTNQPQPSSVSSDDTKVACPICYESLFQRKLLSTICGHVFCELCLRTALRMSKKCPICNRSITRANQTHPLYLPLNES